MACLGAHERPQCGAVRVACVCLCAPAAVATRVTAASQRYGAGHTHGAARQHARPAHCRRRARRHRDPAAADGQTQPTRITQLPLYAWVEPVPNGLGITTAGYHEKINKQQRMHAEQVSLNTKRDSQTHEDVNFVIPRQVFF